MNRSCRSFGTLLSIFEKELCKDAISYYRKHIETILHDGIKHFELVDYFNKSVKELVDAIKVSANSQNENLTSFSKVLSSSPSAIPETPTNLNKNHHEEYLATLASFKQGLESKMPNGYKGLSLEEYCLLGFLSNAIVWDNNGNMVVAIHRFIYGICAHAVELFDVESKPELQKIEMQIERLQQYIRESAKVNDERKIIAGRKLDFSIAFSIFDEECHGFITRSAFCSMVKRMRLISVDSFIPTVYDKIDIHDKGYINIDDLIRFVKGPSFDKLTSHNAVFENSDHEDVFMNNDDLDDDDDDDDVGDTKQSRHSPPTELTRNKDFNWLVWFLWRQCQRVCIEDPTSCVQTLKEKCDSYVPDHKLRRMYGGISLESLWKLLGSADINMRGTLSKRQFDSCITYVVHDGKSSSDAPVDYEALCNYITRIGQANDEKEKALIEQMKFKFKTLWNSLKKELEMMVSESNSKSKYTTPKFTKVLVRLDTNKDGYVSVQQFRMGLRKLNCKTKWSTAMVRELFQHVDNSKPSELNIQEFTNLIVEDAKKKRNEIYNRVYEEERDILFEDHVLKFARKILHEFVPRPEMSDLDDHDVYQHSLTITDHIRDYFRRYDGDGKGLVPAERFVTFSRDSGLKTRMTSIEFNALLRLVEVPRKEGDGKFIDYNKFCYNLVKSDKISIPHKKAESVLQKLQDVSIASAAKGRDFISLASLVDPHLTGRISKQEFVQTVKIMGLVLSTTDVRSILELLPSNDNDRKDNKVDYIEVSKLLKSFQLYEGPLPDPTSTTNYESSKKKRVGALPSYATPGLATRIVSSNKTISVNVNSTITPMGNIVTPFDEASLKRGSTSLKFTDTIRSGDLQNSQSFVTNSYDRVVNSFIAKVEKSIVFKKVPDPSFSLISRFQELDRGSTGYISLVSFQRIIDSLGVSVSSSEITAILSLYGRREDEKINYVAMCNVMRSAKIQNKSSMTYANDRTIARWGELKMSGKRPLQIFEQYDYDGIGLISCLDFREVSRRLNILQSENQLFAVYSDFSSISDTSMVAYKDFCDALDVLERKEMQASITYGSSATNEWSFNTYNNFEDSIVRSKNDSSYNDNDELDPSLSIANVSQWMKHNKSSYDYSQFQRSYESLSAFKLTQRVQIDDSVNFYETQTTYKRK